MSVLTRENCVERCLTCLLKLRESSVPTTEHNSCVKLLNHNDIIESLAKFVDPSLKDLSNRPELPQHLCMKCYTKLNNFDEFCKRARYSYQKITTLLTRPDIEFHEVGKKSEELVQLDADNHVVLGKIDLQESNTLLENESVLLNDGTTAIDVSLHDLDSTTSDPFESLVELESEIISNETDEVPAASVEEMQIDEIVKIVEPNHELAESSVAASTMAEQTQCAVTKKRTRRAVQPRTGDKTRQNKCYKYKCIQCKHRFAQKLTLDAHVRKVHEGNMRPFQCDRCDKSYTFIGGLYTHIKEIHEAERRSYACDHADCGRIYTSFVAMQKHKRLKHSATEPEKRYVCEQCGTAFKQSSNLKYHRRNKHPTDDEAAEKERYYCDICQKQFHSRYTLRYHTLQQHTVSAETCKYVCKVCGRRVAKKFMLVQHMLVHSKDKIPCDRCGRQFIRKFELEAHIRAVHMKLKPFECTYCDESFASRKTLRHHEYIHTGEKPYKCDLCDQAFRQHTCLKNHRKCHDTSLATFAENLNRTLMANAMIEQTIDIKSNLSD